MITLNLPAKMVCVHEGCSASQPVPLVLTATGGLRMVPQSKNCEGWSMGVAQDGVIVCRCPKHPQLVQLAGGTLPKVATP